MLAMRSAAVMEKVTEATLSPIHPDAPAETIESTVVDILNPETPPFAGPIVNPVRVMVTTELAGRAALVIWMTKTAEEIGNRTTPVPPLMKTAGTTDKTKKPEGYVSVILQPGASAPPAVVVKVNVAAADVVPATRSDDAIANEALVT